MMSATNISAWHIWFGIKFRRLSSKTAKNLITRILFIAKDSGKLNNCNITLPLQKYPRKQGNSVFVDDNFNPYADQWNYLHNVKKYTLEEIEKLIRQLTPDGELGELHGASDSEDEKPWENKKTVPKLAKLDFPEKVKVVHANMLYIEKAGISSPALNALKRLAAFSNPEFYKAQAMRLSTHDKPRVISCSAETEQYMCLPRGLEDDACAILHEHGVEVEQIAETTRGREIKVKFDGELRGEQQQASDALLAHDNGVLSATTAFGKTVVGAYLIANRKVNTLILVHRTNLLHQWIDRLNEFLVFLVISSNPLYNLGHGRYITFCFYKRTSEGANHDQRGANRTKFYRYTYSARKSMDAAR